MLAKAVTNFSLPMDISSLMYSKCANYTILVNRNHRQPTLKYFACTEKAKL